MTSLMGGGHQKWLLRLVLAVVLSRFSFDLVQGEGYPLHKQDFVTPLTDETFEDRTTASTARSWLIWFHRKRDDTPIAGPVPSTEEWEEVATTVATVDAIENYRTRARFEVDKLPAFVYVHEGKYSKLDSSPEGYVYNWNDILAFCREPGTAKDIPPPRTWKDDVAYIWEKLQKELGGIYIQSMGAFFAFMSVVAILNQLFIEKKKDPQRPKQPLKQKQS